MTNTINIFEHINGTDLERLCECLKAIKAANLRVDCYTQAGINQNSGNVWVWSEDWPGCVYCSSGFDVNWSYSCPSCGEEHDFGTYQELVDYAEAQDGYCDVCTTD